VIKVGKTNSKASDGILGETVMETSESFSRQLDSWLSTKSLDGREKRFVQNGTFASFIEGDLSESKSRQASRKTTIYETSPR
jgi:hypothetical protein